MFILIILFKIIAAIYLFSRKFIDVEASKLILAKFSEKNNAFLIRQLVRSTPEDMGDRIMKRVSKVSRIVFFISIILFIFYRPIVGYALFQILFLSSLFGFLFIFSIEWLLDHKSVLKFIFFKSPFLLLVLSPLVIYIIELLTGMPVATQSVSYTHLTLPTTSRV